MSNFDIDGESADIFNLEVSRLPKTAEPIRLSTGSRINLTFRTIYSTDAPFFDVA
tara:strand:- start:2085 stop:2249 length:165 start_codon:yes stop_codon:yes gene_type:complete